MKREFWEERYQKGDTPWEKGHAAPPLTEFLARRRVTGRVLVPGCGTGHDVRALAKQGAGVVGLDFAPSAVRLASTQPSVAGETYVLGDLFSLPAGLRGGFDWVFEHTCLSAISPKWRGHYLRGVCEALKPEGRLLAIFFINPDHEGNGPPFGISREELDALFGPFFALEEEWVPAASYPGREGRELMRMLRQRTERSSVSVTVGRRFSPPIE